MNNVSRCGRLIRVPGERFSTFIQIYGNIRTSSRVMFHRIQSDEYQTPTSAKELTVNKWRRFELKPAAGCKHQGKDTGAAKHPMWRKVQE